VCSSDLPVALSLPMTYGFDAVRGLLLNTRTLLPIPVEVGVLLVVMVVFIFLGLWSFRRLERRVRQKGTLHQF
jgi:ABC-2 type transport system permease protein